MAALRGGASPAPAAGNHARQQEEAGARLGAAWPRWGVEGGGKAVARAPGQRPEGSRPVRGRGGDGRWAAARGARGSCCPAGSRGGELGRCRGLAGGGARRRGWRRRRPSEAAKLRVREGRRCAQAGVAGEARRRCVRGGVRPVRVGCVREAAVREWAGGGFALVGQKGLLGFALTFFLFLFLLQNQELGYVL